ncbi:hypothetical protein OIU84_015907 [Salix udensis]|uniref:B box-type domain-containing protein n=1 Tax=Salix udensis TaxID=889485 RepID=A0AAD6NNY6_9ROSI|nr:hypothetical protein OIU84_015907 [Salix udensis]
MARVTHCTRYYYQFARRRSSLCVQSNSYFASILTTPEHKLSLIKIQNVDFFKSSTTLPGFKLFSQKNSFDACFIHKGARKNERNIFCLDCCVSICPHCLPPHNSHRLLQIRRYVYNDVLRLDDAQKLFDCASVQSYTTNSAKYPYLFCSISCKVDHILTTKGVAGLSSFFCDCKFLPLPEPGSDDGLMTPDSVLEPSGSTKTSSSSGGYGGVDCRTLACTATTEIVRKKRSSLTSSCRTMYPRITEISSNLMSRRKKAPSRAPLY